MSSRGAHGSSKGVKGQNKGKSSKTKVVEVVDSGIISVVVTGAPDEMEGQTLCDKCDKWHHFGCVGVTEEVADHSWSCPKCLSAEWAQRTGSTSSKQLQPARGAKNGTDVVNQRMSEDPDKKCEQGSVAVLDVDKEQASSQKEADGKQSRSGSKGPKETNSKQVQSDSKKANSLEESSILSISSSRRSSGTLLKLQLQKLEEEERLARDFLERKYALLEEAASEKSSRASSSLSRVRDWVHGNKTNRKEGAMLNPNEDIFDPERHSTKNPAQFESLNPLAAQRERMVPLRQDQLTIGRTFSVKATSNDVGRPTHSAGVLANRECGPERLLSMRHYASGRSKHQEESDDQCLLSKRQLAARQAVSKDLPSFSGNPEEWPLLYSSYINTTTMCGFTDAENAIRLQNA
ncbi:uncharacterized protein LOC134209172 [Armigeres subalbatus]|uniref:uncharacterized protein LOC134209172 n=1 Tax=Armigeres subalbatus TaxID=124917 RepID=UPI002ED466F5